jgi:hypothetical protein
METKKWFRFTNLKVAHGGLVTAMREERQRKVNRENWGARSQKHSWNVQKKN